MVDGGSKAPSKEDPGGRQDSPVVGPRGSPLDKTRSLLKPCLTPLVQAIDDQGEP